MRELAVACGGTATEPLGRRGERRQVVSCPPALRGEWRQLWDTQPAPPPPSDIAHAWLPRGRVFGAGIVLSPDGTLIARDVTEDLGKPFHEHWLKTYERIRFPLLHPGRLGVAATTLGSGYSH